MTARGVGAVALLALVACAAEEPGPSRPGGDTTVEVRTSVAFSLPAPNLTPEELEHHLAGDVAFDATFVTGAAPVHGGLGRVFNNTSCTGCHNRDGRGRPTLGEGATSQALVRVSLAGGTPEVPGGAVPVPRIGTQIQDHAVFGATPEAAITLAWTERPGAYGDGEAFSLRAPNLTILVEGTPLAADVATSLRLPPAVFGLGLLEAVAAETLAGLADPDDDDGDGISGRTNTVWDPRAGVAAVGRFGLKANTVDLEVQAAAAYANDMGIGNPLFVDVDGNTTELAERDLAAAAFYTRTLGVPARAPMTEAARRGEQRFADFGCARCHTPRLRTGAHPIAALAEQDIEPYTDLLLHDLGDGLADGRPDFAASAREWRTPPLWGLGLVEVVLPGASYLHDGRARTLAEAILWHGGEAEHARERFRLASRRDRDAVLAFLRAL